MPESDDLPKCSGRSMGDARVTVELGPHLHRIGNDMVAAYLVVTADGITLIDAGLPGHWRDLQQELKLGLGSRRGIRGVGASPTATAITWASLNGCAETTACRWPSARRMRRTRAAPRRRS